MAYIYVKRFAKNPVTLLSTLFLFGWMIWLLFFVADDGLSYNIDDAFEYFRTVLPVAFFLFMIISYELFYQQKKNCLEEVIGCDRWGKLKENSIIFVIMIFIDIVATGVILLFFRTFYDRYDVNEINYWNYNVRVTLIYFTLAMVFGILVGCIASEFRKRMFGVCMLIAVFYFFDESFVSVMMCASTNMFPLWRFSTIFFLFCQHSVSGYFLSAENVNIYRIFFWIFIALAIVLFKKLHKKYIALIPLTVGIISLVMFLMPSGACYGLRMVNGYDWDYHDQFYYSNFLNDYYVDAKKYTEMDRNDFIIEKYNMDIKVTDVLNADVLVTPNVDGLESYQFTLYHRYKVSDVFSGDGEKLKFSQASDYLEVFSGGKKLDKIRICYSGYSPWFYSTTQGLYLPGNFAYYPMSGWREVYNRYDEDKISDFLPNTLGNMADFNVSVKCAYPLFSNFEVTGGGKKGRYFDWRLQGVSDALSLLGSPYTEESDFEGVRVVYSKMGNITNPKTNPDEYKEVFAEMKKMGYSLEGKTLLNDPHEMGSFEDFCIADDHVSSSFLTLTTHFEEFYGGGDSEEQVRD